MTEKYNGGKVCIRIPYTCVVYDTLQKPVYGWISGVVYGWISGVDNNG